MGTRQLVRGYLEGGELELGAVLERLRPRLVLWCASRMSPALRARLEPEDAAQEILLTVYRGISKFRGEDARTFLAWFFRVAENRLRGLATWFAAAKRQQPEAQERALTSPSSAAARTERQAALLGAVEALGDHHREVIRLRCIEHREVAEVAEILERSPTAVRVLYCRALKALRRALTGSSRVEAANGAQEA